MIHEDNERILTLMSEYLCFTPTAISPAEVHTLAQDCGISPNEAYMALLAARCGLDTTKPEDARLYRAYFPRMLREHSPDTYRDDAYMQAVRPTGGTCGSVDLVEETLQPMELFVADDFVTDAQGCVFPQMGWFSGEFSFPAIREDGRVWMTVTPNEINTIQPAVQQTRGKVLTYGLGLGYYAFHALLREDVSSVTVVEKNPQVIDVFRRLLAWCELALKPGGAFAFELHETCLDTAADEAGRAGFCEIRIISDLAGRPRVLTGRAAGKASYR